MSYDKDLFAVRRGCWALACVNFGLALGGGWWHDWSLVLPCVIWGLSCLLVVKHAETQQRTRDEVRLVCSGVRAMLERQEL